MKNKTFVMGTVVGVFIILFINAVIVCWIDPYQQYHKPLKELSYPMEMNSFAYYNPGIAKNYEYDTVITGSSMSRAFFDKLCRPGAAMSDGKIVDGRSKRKRFCRSVRSFRTAGELEESDHGNRYIRI